MKTSLKSSLPLILMVAVAALGFGIWFGLGDNGHDEKRGSEHAQVTEIDLTDFLTQSYQTPHGETVAVESLMSELNLINFWATWCAPCRHEMPLFETFYLQHGNQGFSVMGLTIDDPEPAETFLQSVGITYPVIMLGDGGWELLDHFGNPQGLLPYSILADKSGKVLERKLGEIDAQLLSAWIKKHLK